MAGRSACPRNAGGEVDDEDTMRLIALLMLAVCEKGLFDGSVYFAETTTNLARHRAGQGLRK